MRGDGETKRERTWLGREAWRFGPGNGRAAGGLCDRLRNEFRGGPDVRRDGLRASIKWRKVSQGSEHVDAWNSRPLG